MARGRRRVAVQVTAIDSLAAVILSAMGVLFFVVIYVAISAYGLSAVITTPLVTTSTTTPVYFECRDNTIFKPGITELSDRTIAAFNQCLEGTFARVHVCEQALAAKPIENAFYLTKPRALRCNGVDKPYPGMSFIEIPGAKGDGLLELQDTGSEFQRELATLDPRRHHLIFIVRNDSFAVFHAARRVSRKIGFRSGWEPIDRKMEIGFGCPGGPSGFRALPQ